MSHCEGIISTISGHSLRSPRLWAGGVRTKIRTNSSPVHGSTASPRSIRRWDSDEELPCCNARRARTPRITDVPAVPMSPTAVSSRDPNAIIYDGRPSILPVSISLADMALDDVVDLPSVIAPPGGNGREMVGRVVGRLQQWIQNRQSYRKSQVTHPDLGEEIRRFQPQPLQAVSPLSTTSMVGVMTSPSQYPAPVAPVVPSVASSTRVSPALIWEAYSPGTLDVFPTYVPSPDVSLYVPTTSPVTPAQIIVVLCYIILCLFSGGGGGGSQLVVGGGHSFVARVSLYGLLVWGDSAN